MMLDELPAADPQITDPNQVVIGDEIMGRRRMSRDVLGLLVVLLIVGQSSTAAATGSTSGSVYGGTFAWTTPALTVVPPTGHGFLGVTAFHGRFVAVERDGVASTSVEGASWVGHALPGPNGGARSAFIAAGTNSVVIIGRGVAWTSVDGDAWTAAVAPPLGPSEPTAMAAVADAFVAVGIAPAGRRAAAWVSADGSSWTAVADQAAFDHFCPTAVATATTGRVVAVGDDCYPHLARPTAAISDDGGLTWQRAKAQAQLSEEGRLTAVVAGGPGFIAVGSVIRDVYPGVTGTAMFVSEEGLAWRRAGYFEPGSGRLGPLLIAIPGGYLAVATGGPKPGAFVSVDGQRWTRSTSLPATPHATNDDYDDAINGLAVSGTTIVVVGTSDLVRFTDATVPGAFTSVGALTPGPAVTGQIPVLPAVPTPVPPPVPAQPSFPGRVTWAVRPFPVSAPPGAVVLGSGVSDVARWRSGFAAVGWTDFAPPIPGRAVVWTSADGAHWTEHWLPSDCGGAGHKVAATQSAIVVASHASICRSPDGIRWTRATDTPRQIRGVVDVTAGVSGFILTMAYNSSATVSVRVWRSADGLRWRSVGNSAAFGNLEPQAVAAGPKGTVILGRQYVPGSGYDMTVKPLRSRDGVVWSSGLRQRAFEPSAFDGGVASMISGGPGYVAAGSYQPRSQTGAAIWTSPDGLAWTRRYVTLPASGYVEFNGLARIGRGYAVVGLLAPPSQEDPALPTVWLSPDAVRWRSGVSLPLPTDGPVAWVDITGVAAGSASIVAVGSRYDGAGSGKAQVWTATYHAP